MTSSISSTRKSDVSVLQSISASAFDDGGDIAAKLDAIRSAVLGQLTQNTKTHLATQGARQQQFSAMVQLTTELPGLSVLSDSSSVALGADTDAAAALMAHLSAAGVSLQTSASCYIQVEGGAKHIASPAELAAAQSGTLTSSSTSPDVQTRSAGGKSYTLYLDEGAVTANKDDVAALTAQIAADLPSAQLAAQLEATRLQASIQTVRAQLQGEGTDPPQEKKIDTHEMLDHADKKHLDAAKEEISKEIRRQFVMARDDAQRKAG